MLWGILVKIKKIIKFLLAVSVLAVLIPLQSELQARVQPRVRLQQTRAVVDKRAEIVVDVETGRILHDYKSNHIRHPASLTKLMTLYLMFEAIDSGKLTPSSPVVFSRFAVSKPPSKLGIRAGKSITLRDAAYTLIIRSANDVAAAVAETLGSTEENFAKLMTQKARQLGMTRTVFVNASGLPDIRQITTAKDMAILGLRLMQHYPHYYKYFSTLTKTVAGIPLSTHNHLLKTYKGMDGMKTGFVNMSGFNLVASAERDKKRLITVVMGGESYRTRDNRVVALTNEGWQRLKNLNDYQQFIGISMPQIVALKTSFRPLEAKQPSAIMSASLVQSKQNTIASHVQKINPIKATKNSIEYSLKEVSETQSSGWTQTIESDNDDIADLIKQSQTQSFHNQNTQARDDFQPIPVEDALLYDKNTPSSNEPDKNILKIPNNKPLNEEHITEKWTVQVGAFSKKNAADNYLNELMRKYDNFSEAHPELIAVKKGDDYIYRARFSGMSSDKAKEACSLLKRMGRYCIMTDLAS